MQRRAGPGFVVLRQLADGQWQLLGEARRRRGLTARAARSAAISEVTGGTAKSGEVYAAILRSEWRVAMDWTPPSPTGQSTPRSKRTTTPHPTRKNAIPDQTA